MTSLASMDPFVRLECTLRLLLFDSNSFLLSNYYCSGTSKETKGTAYIVYDDIYDAKNACEHLSGFNLLGRYLIVLYWQPNKAVRRSTEGRRAELELLKTQYNL